MIRSLTGIFLLTSATLVSAQTITEKAEQDEVYIFREDDPAMLAAYEQAEATLDDFLKIWQHPKPQQQNFAVKVAITKNDRSEFFWILPFVQTESGFSGILSNEPRWVSGVKSGDQIDFSQSQIVDWMYIDEHGMQGNYTACALLTHEPPESQAIFQQQYGLSCE